MNTTRDHSAALDKWARWAATSTPAGTEPGTLDALEAATGYAARRLDALGVPFTYADLQDTINAHL